MRWGLGTCGDGVYNSSSYSFEQCDKFASPPQAPGNTYKYPSPTNWLRKDIFYDPITRNYYTCSDICLSQPISLCGDGYESNGPYTENSALRDTREYCDDGNNIANDGCTNCVIDLGYECQDDYGVAKWGPGSCRPKCGNAILDAPYPVAGGGTFTEQCDLGVALNAPST